MDKKNGVVWGAVIIAALVVAGLMAGTAAAATPVITLDKVVAPSGPYDEANPVNTTWHVGLAGLNGWDHTSCSSTGHYRDQDGVQDDLEGDDADPTGPWNSWSFQAETPHEYVVDPVTYGYSPVYERLESVTAACKLTRRIYLGLRARTKTVSFYRSGSATSSRRPNGCKVYSYSAGRLTIDCRHSRTSGSASWRFRTTWRDYRASWGGYFDRSESTMGPHRLTGKWGRKGLIITETVSPGTMITVTEIDVDLKRRYWVKAYRNEAKTLRATWVAP